MPSVQCRVWPRVPDTIHGLHGLWLPFINAGIAAQEA
jgi:hypothetical protein